MSSCRADPARFGRLSSRLSAERQAVVNRQLINRLQGGAVQSPRHSTRFGFCSSRIRTCSPTRRAACAARSRMRRSRLSSNIIVDRPVDRIVDPIVDPMVDQLVYRLVGRPFHPKAGRTGAPTSSCSPVTSSKTIRCAPTSTAGQYLNRWNCRFTVYRVTTIRGS